MKKIFFVTFISSVALLLLINPVLACGPSFPTYYHTPDNLIGAHNLNIDFKNSFSKIDSSDQIIFENLNTQYLYPLYQKMVKKPLSTAIKQALYFNDPNVSTWMDPELTEAIKQWKKTRKIFLNDDSVIEQYGLCRSYAFNKAVTTLQNLQKNYSKDQVVEWIKNQDAVFAQCNHAIDEVPQSAPPSTTTVEVVKIEPVGFFNKVTAFISMIFDRIFNRHQIDRPAVVENSTNTKTDVLEVKYTGQLQYNYEYQQAALAYYSGQRTKAETFFTLISNNPNHPWNAPAAYSLGLLYIGDDYAKAEQQFKDIIANPKYSEFHQAASGMLDYILAQRDPFALFKKVENKLVSSNDTATLKQALTDYLYLWPSPDFYKETYSPKDIEFEKRIIKEGNDMSQWILIWRHYQIEYLNLIKDKYKATGSEPWLLAMARFLPTNDSDYKKVEQKVSQLLPTSPAFWTANYYIIDKTIADGDIVKVRRLINNLPHKNVSVVVKDYLEDFKMRTADSIIELFKHAERHAYEVSGVGFTTEAEDKIVAEIPFLDNKAKVIFETQLPLNKQVDLVLRNDVFATKQTKFLRLITMVRAFLLKDYDNARRIAVVLAQSDVELAKDLSQFLAASTAESKEYGAVVFMLRYPGIGIGIYDNAMVDKTTNLFLKSTRLYPRGDYKEIFNYNAQRWDYCQPIRYISGNDLNGGDDKEIPIDTRHADYNISFVEKIISRTDQELAGQQLKSIFNNAPANYFATVVLAYAEKHPNSKTVPEALHLVVQATRFASCSDDDTSAFSKKAFKLLHYKYPANYWTRQTPYYY